MATIATAAQRHSLVRRVLVIQALHFALWATLMFAVAGTMWVTK
jgi:hypothetical protein